MPLARRVAAQRRHCRCAHGQRQVGVPNEGKQQIVSAGVGSQSQSANDPCGPCRIGIGDGPGEQLAIVEFQQQGGGLHRERSAGFGGRQIQQLARALAELELFGDFDVLLVAADGFQMPQQRGLGLGLC